MPLTQAGCTLHKHTQPETDTQPLLLTMEPYPPEEAVTFSDSHNDVIWAGGWLIKKKSLQVLLSKHTCFMLTENI